MSAASTSMDSVSTLERSLRVLEECEESAIATTTELAQNREKLEKIQKNVRVVTAEMDVAKGTTRRMIKRSGFFWWLG